ncbi:MAG: EAL domain-containing response regulator [Alphaproteobacteria bacterium]|nr:EAL domain-containing response regulator [Alphaproteobacteria bacterium]
MIASGLNFLVIDDDDFLQLATKNMLRSFNAAKILAAPNGIKALEILQVSNAEPIDIILCDLNMPGMDGMEFLRHLGESHYDVSVIVVSSHDDALIAAVKKMALAYGIRLLGSIQKPISRAQLEALILQHKSARPKTPPTAAAAPVFTLEDILRGVEERLFEPFYQPKIEFKTGLISGAEALARWIHPRHGVIAPYAFIRALETSGNIDGLTFLILEKASAACRLLHDKGHAIPISVNLSLTSLSNPALADKITRVVRNAGIDPQYIILEVTESATMTNVAPALENLARLRMHGFGLSIDDYGTGSSSLQQITRIAFSELKIDRSFVNDCSNNRELSVVVRSSIEMAHKLKIKCIAEGVETRQDWETLKGMDCDTAQGYFIAKPMNLASFLEFCAGYSPEALLAP